MPRIIGLTGLIGTGKSTVARLMVRMGVRVHDADACVHMLYRDPDVQRQLLAAFPEARSWRGGLDREKLMNSLKNDPVRKILLESIIHPLVASDRMAFTRKYRKARVLVYDVPLLFESGADRLCNQVWVTHCRPALQRARVLHRKGFDEKKLETILKWQGNGRWKRQAADLVINTGARRSVIVRRIKKALRSL